MAVESLTVSLGGGSGSKIKGKDLINGNVNDNQIVTVVDNGNIANTVTFEFWGMGRPTESGAGAGGDDTFYFDLSGFNDDFTILVKSFDELDYFIFTEFDSYSQSGTVTTINYTGSDGLTHTIKINANSLNGTGVVSVIPCFARGTEILTDNGERPVETLSAGDKVICGDGQAREIRWVGGRVLDAATLRNHPEALPIRFGKNALGEGLPSHDLRLSPQHRVLIADWRAELFFGEPEVLVSAKSLINDKDIRPEYDCTSIEYFHILLDSHDTIFANGVACESLMPAELTNHALSSEARDEIFLILPELVGDLGRYGPTCKRVLRAYEAHALIA